MLAYVCGGGGGGPGRGAGGRGGSEGGGGAWSLHSARRRSSSCPNTSGKLVLKSSASVAASEARWDPESPA